MDHAKQTPVAIIGTGCRAPGGVSSTEDLWQVLLDRRDVVAGSDPGRRWTERERVVPGDLVGSGMLRSGSFLDGIDLFDPGFFGVPVREAPSIDPQHRLLMETTWEALEDAGIPPRSLAGSRTGLFTGIFGADYARRFTIADFDVYHGISAVPAGAPGRISYILDVHGPSLAVDGACASSLLAVHLACRSLHEGESDLALAGGVTVQLEWGGIIGFARAGALSERGRCAAFDAGADGFVRGEGCGVVVLKRLADAQRDGDRVLAVVAGTAINHAGRVRGITQPSRVAQREVVAAAMRAAGVGPDDIGYVEAHGTGTPVGDPIEFAALSDAHGSASAPCALGSLKTNFGHPECAAGVLGLIKAALAVQRGVVPANLHFTRWNPEIDAEGTRFFVPTEATPWTGAPRRAAVSAFGVTGANAHAIVEQAPPAPAPPQDRPVGRLAVHPVSAASPGGLAATAARLADHIETARPHPADVAHTLAVARSPLTARACVLATDRDGLVDGLRALAGGEAHPAVVTGPTGAAAMPVWVFSGHGAQWAGMARGLLDRDPAFTGMIDRLAPVAAGGGVPLRELLEADALPERMDLVQPLVFAVQTALAEVWRAWGLRPAAVVGHSMGEAAAAVAAGIIAPEDGMRITLIRSSMLQRVAGGCMAAVALPVEQVAAEIADRPGVSIAVVTAPATTVVAGAEAAVAELLGEWQDRGVFSKRIAVVVAAHSPQVDPIIPDVVEQTSWLAGQAPAVPFYSTVVDPREPVEFTGRYWAQNLREPVRFDRACRALVEDGHRVFLEIAPHPLLAQAVEETGAALGAPVVAVPSLMRDQDDREALCQAAAALHVAGVPVDIAAVNGGGSRTALPPTAFDRARYWQEPPSGARGADAHMWLGARIAVPDPDAEDRTRHVWTADLGTDRVDWLRQHTLRGTPLVPAAAHVELLVAAATDLLGCAPDQVGLTGVRFERMVPLAARVPVQVAAVRRGEAVDLAVLQAGGAGWDRVAAATATRCEGAVDGREPLPLPEATDPPDDLYAECRRIGLDTGPAFHSIAAVADGGLARLRLPEEATVSTAAPKVHPVLLDGCVLAVAAPLVMGGGPDPGNAGAPWVPVGIGALTLPADPNRVAWVRPEVRRDGPDTATGRADLYDDAGTWLGALDGVALVRGPAPAPGRSLLNSRLFEITWTPAPLPAADPRALGDWVVVAEPGDRAGVAERVAAALAAAGARVEVDADAPRGDSAEGVVWCATGDLDALDRITRIGMVLRDHAGHRAPPRLWLVSANARPVADGEPVDPGVCALRGLLRVAAIEQPQSAVTWIDSDDPAGPGAADIAAELVAGSPEPEVALRSGQRHVARMTRAPLPARPPRTAGVVEVVAGADGFALEADPDGGVERLRLVAAEQPPPAPGPGQVLLRPEAVTIHFRDVLIALGIYPTDDGVLPGLGSDAAGVVLAVGPDVPDLRPGDRVVAVRPDGTGTMASSCLVTADLVVGVPDGVASVDIVPSVLTYLTAWHALHDLAHLRAGETVLVHSAAGGTGLAAIEVARLLGATPIGTAGTEAKRRYLRDHGVEHVFDSRTLDFAEEVREATGGRGVDVVLNSLTGAAMRASLDLLAPLGRFVEIGKRDLYDGARIGLDAFRRGNTYTALDLVLTATEHTAVCRAALLRVAAELAAGTLPALPRVVLPLAEAAEGFKLLASGDHIGRIALEFPEPGERLRVHAPARESVVRPGGAYIITGGTRGLGLAAARWLAERGAGRVVVGGRGEVPAEGREVLAEVEALGCAVEVVRGDIADPQTARRLVAAAGGELRGVLHTAVVLDDTPITGLTPEKVERVWHPKVTGLLNLHDATADSTLDWFVVFSSMSAMIGNAGQANYAAAGAWVDAFARWRRDRGLPALSVDWGAWGEAGRATHFAARGYDTISTADGFAALEELLRHQRVHTGVFDYQPDLLFRAFPDARSTPLLAEVDTPGGRAEDGALGVDVRAVEPGPARAHLLQDVVVRTLAALLSADPSSVPAHAKFTDVGLDSLLAVALTRRLQTDVDIALTPAEVWAHPSPAELAAHLDSVL